MEKNISIKTSSNHSFSIGVMPAAPELFAKASGIAKKLAIPIVPVETSKIDFLLIYSVEGLALKPTAAGSPGPIMASFTNPAITYRIRHGGGKRQALARAVGLKKGWQPTVIDATAGLGRDSFILAWLGCYVHMLERSPILTAMLTDALQRAKYFESTSEIVGKRLKLTQADSRHFLHTLKPAEFPDVIYLDPMYPERTKSSQVKKEMRLLRKIAGSDRDAEELLPLALARVRNRVVVKRPRLAKVLGKLKPSHQITGKSSRFDIYLV